jgi:hypothetical protein
MPIPIRKLSLPAYDFHSHPTLTYALLYKLLSLRLFTPNSVNSIIFIRLRHTSMKDRLPIDSIKNDSIFIQIIIIYIYLLIPAYNHLMRKQRE